MDINFIQETIDSLRTLTQQNGALTRQNSQLINEAAKESTINTKAEEIKQTVQNINLSSLENKMEEGVNNLSNKIDSIKLPEIDTTELAKQGENAEATNSKILEEVAKEQTLNDSVAALSALIEDIPSKVAVTRVTDLVATENDKEYIANDYGVDGFGKVKTELRKLVKVFTVRVNKYCINSDGRWEGDVLIDTSEVNSSIVFDSCDNLLYIDTSNWDTSKCTSISFQQCSKIKRLDTSKWNTDKITSFNASFIRCYELQDIDVTNWNMDNVTNTLSMFNGCSSLVSIDTTNWNFYSITKTGAYSMFFGCNNLISIIGDRDMDDVLMHNVKCLNGNISTLSLSETILERPSLRAVINGLADLTGEDPQTLTLGATLIAKLTEEDIAIATNKNWTIV